MGGLKKKNGRPMNRTPKSLAEFASAAAMARPRRRLLEQELDELKEQLLTPLLHSVGNARLVAELRWVANEVSALAWFSACPILVLPVLLEEKTQQALHRWRRQEQIRASESVGRHRAARHR